MRAWPVLFLLLAGCSGAGGGSTEDAAGSDPAATGEALHNSTLALLPPFDPWTAGEAERVLFDGTVQAGECYPQAYANEATRGYVMGGCAYLALDEGTYVPPGTAALRFDVDASQALKAGSYFPFFNTRGRVTPADANLDATTEPVHSWTEASTPMDWDPSPDEPSALFAGIWSANEGASVPVLSGAVQVRLVAVHDLAWNASAYPDPWLDPGNHSLPQPGVLTLLDENVSLACPGTQSASTTCSPFDPLADAVPVGTRFIVFAGRLGTVDGCPPQATCHLRTPIQSAWLYNPLANAVHDEVGPDWRILVFDQTTFFSDPPWAAARSTSFAPWIDLCLPSEQTPNCNSPAYPDLSAPVHYLVEAWKGDVSLDAVKARMQV